MIKRSTYIVYIVILLVSCQQKQIDTIDVAKLDNINTANSDSLIHDYNFGMTKEDFYEYSWSLNSKGIVSNGNGAEIAEDINWLKAPAKRIFYPVFIDGKIAQLPVSYRYNGWAPWNSHLYPEELIKELLPILEEEYGARFDTLRSKDRNLIYIATLGKTEITVRKETHSNAIVIFRDINNTYSKNN